MTERIPFGNFVFHRPRVGLLIATLSLSVMLLGSAAPLEAGVDGTIVVFGTCSLADAIRSANTDTDTGGCTGAGGEETIILDEDVALTAPNTVDSTSLFGTRAGLPDVLSTMTIQAGAASRIERDTLDSCPESASGDRFRLLNVLAGMLTLEGLTLEKGCASRGAAILVQELTPSTGAALSLDQVVLRLHSARGFASADPATDAALGGAVYVGTGGSLVGVDGATFEANVAIGGSDAGASGEGGAIYLGSGAEGGVLAESTFSNNAVLGGSAGGVGLGGAVSVAEDASLTAIRGCRFEGNQSVGAGGVAFVPGGLARGGALAAMASTVASTTPLEIQGSVFRDNVAQGGAGDMSFGGAADGGALWLERETTLEGVVLGNNLARGGDGGQPTAGGDTRGGAVAMADGGLLNVQMESNAAVGGFSTFGGSVGRGGGLAVLGATTAERVTLVGNVAQGDPGGTGFGGGAWIGGSGSSWQGVTVVGNRAVGRRDTSGDDSGASAFGGGIAVVGDLELRASTVAGNDAREGLPSGSVEGGGLWTDSTIEVESSIVEENRIGDTFGQTGDEDCRGAGVVSSGANLVGVPTTCTFASAGDQVGVVDPGLLPRGEAGCDEALPDGLCLTVVPLAPGGPALDQGRCSLSTVDARGFARPFDLPGVPNFADGCDIGSFELIDLDGDGADDTAPFFLDGFESGSFSAWSGVV